MPAVPSRKEVALMLSRVEAEVAKRIRTEGLSVVDEALARRLHAIISGAMRHHLLSAPSVPAGSLSLGQCAAILTEVLQQFSDEDKGTGGLLVTQNSLHSVLPTPIPDETTRDAKDERMHKASERGFIGSSSENREIAETLQMLLNRKGIRASVWHQGFFGLSRGTLENLDERGREYTFAVLVLAADDLQERRGDLLHVPRDNVILELGLFIGIVGRLRVFMVVEKGTTIPSDLNGITVAEFTRPAGTIAWEDELGPIATEIAKALERAA